MSKRLFLAPPPPPHPPYLQHKGLGQGIWSWQAEITEQALVGAYADFKCPSSDTHVLCFCSLLIFCRILTLRQNRAPENTPGLKMKGF